MLNQLIVSGAGRPRSPRLQTGEYFYHLDLLYYAEPVGIFLSSASKISVRSVV